MRNDVDARTSIIIRRESSNQKAGARDGNINFRKYDNASSEIRRLTFHSMQPESFPSQSFDGKFQGKDMTGGND